MSPPTRCPLGCRDLPPPQHSGPAWAKAPFVSAASLPRRRRRLVPGGRAGAGGCPQPSPRCSPERAAIPLTCCPPGWGGWGSPAPPPQLIAEAGVAQGGAVRAGMSGTPLAAPHRGSSMPTAQRPVPPWTLNHPTSRGGGNSQQPPQHTAKGFRDTPPTLQGAKPPLPTPYPNQPRTSLLPSALPAPARMDPRSHAAPSSRRDRRPGCHRSNPNRRVPGGRGVEAGGKAGQDEADAVGRAGASVRVFPLSLWRLSQPSKSFPSPRPPFLPALPAMVHCTSQPSRGGRRLTLQHRSPKPTACPWRWRGGGRDGIGGFSGPSSTGGHCCGSPGLCLLGFYGVCVGILDLRDPAPLPEAGCARLGCYLHPSQDRAWHRPVAPLTPPQSQHPQAGGGTGTAYGKRGALTLRGAGIR